MKRITYFGSLAVTACLGAWEGFQWLTTALLAAGTAVIAINPELLEQAEKWERLQERPGGVSRWWAMLPLGAFILYRLFDAAWKLHREAQIEINSLNEQLKSAEAKLEDNGRIQKQKEKLGEFFLIEGRQLYNEKLTSDDELEKWMTRVRNWLRVRPKTPASRGLQPARTHRIRVWGRTLNRTAGEIETLISRADAASFLEINVAAADIIDGVNYNREHNNIRLNIKAHCQNLSNMISGRP